jgi:photosystem I subunit X
MSLFNLPLLAAASVAPTLQWSPLVGLTMIICNVIAIALGKFTIKYPNAKPEMPSASMFGGFGLPAVIGTTCLGHIIGAGAILGLNRLGVL